MAKLMNTVKSLRSQLAALNVASNAKPTVVVQTANAELLEIFKSEVAVVSSLVKAGETIVLGANEEVPTGCLKGFVSDEISIYVKVIGLIDIKLEIGRINKRAPRTYPRGTTCASFAERIWKWTRKAGANRRSCRADTPFICIAFGLGWNASKRARRADSLSYPNANDAPTLRGKRRKKRSGSLYRQSCKPDTYRQRWLRSWTAR